MSFSIYTRILLLYISGFSLFLSAVMRRAKAGASVPLVFSPICTAASVLLKMEPCLENVMHCLSKKHSRVSGVEVGEEGIASGMFVTLLTWLLAQWLQ